MLWSDVVSDPRFAEKEYDEQKRLADTFLKRHVEAEPKFLGFEKEKQESIRNYVYSKIGQAEGIGGWLGGWKRGVANIGSIQTGTLELLANYMPADLPLIGSEDFVEASIFWKKQWQKIEGEPRTGRYAMPIQLRNLDPTHPRSPLNPKRIYTTLSEGLPLMGVFIGAYMANPILSTALMTAVEGGDYAQTLREHEEKTGEEVPEWQKKTVPLTIGFINAMLERWGISTIIGNNAITRNVKSRVIKALIASGIEGSEEFAQEGVKIIGKHVQDIEPWSGNFEELWDNFYGGALLGGLLGGAFPAAVTEKPTEPVPGAPSDTKMSPDMQLAVDGMMKSSRRSREESTPENVQDFDNKVSDLATSYFAEHPEDTSDDFIAFYDGLNLKIEPPLEQVRITDEEAKAMEFNVTLSNGRAVRIRKFHKGIEKINVERALTAVNWLNRYAPEHMKLIDEIVLSQQSDTSWLNMLSEELVGKPFKRLNAELKTYLQNNYGDADGTIFAAEGKVFFRAAAHIPGTYGYVNTISHENEHIREARIKAWGLLTEEERAAQELRAQDVGMELQRKFLKMEEKGLQNLQFQYKDELLGLLKSEQVPNMDARLRMLRLTAGIFSGVTMYSGQRYSPAGEEINAAVETTSGELYLSKLIDWNTIPHEATEMIIAKLGMDNKIVQEGIKLFGDKELLSDAVGDYFLGELDPSLLSKVERWVKRLWAEFKNVIGVELAREDIVALFNSRIIGERNKIMPRLRFFDNLEKMPRRVNLDQLSFKNVPSEEIDVVKRTVARLKKKGMRIVTGKELEDAIINDMVDITVETEMEVDARESFRKWLEAPRTLILEVDGVRYDIKEHEEGRFSATMQNKRTAAYIQVSGTAEEIAKASVAFAGEQPFHRARMLPEEYTVGKFAPESHRRLLFESSYNFNEPAHEGLIESTTAIGWAEVADSEDGSTLIAFEIQPSDALKKLSSSELYSFVEFLHTMDDLAGLQQYLLNNIAGIKKDITPYDIYDPYFVARYSKAIKAYMQIYLDPEQWALASLSPKVNRFMYRSLIQWAARHGYKKIRFPYGQTAATIEGGPAVVPLYNAIAKRMLKEYKGRAELVKEPELASYEGMESYIITTVDMVKERLQKVKLGGPPPYLKSSMLMTDFYVSVAQGKIQLAIKSPLGDKVWTGDINIDLDPWLQELEALLLQRAEQIKPRWLEISLTTLDGTSGAYMFQTKKTNKEAYSKYVANINLDTKNFGVYFKRLIKEKYDNLMPEDPQGWQWVRAMAYSIIDNPALIEDAIKRLQTGKGITPIEAVAINVYSTEKVKLAIKKEFTIKAVGAVVRALEGKAALWLQLMSLNATEAGRYLNYMKIFDPGVRLLEDIREGRRILKKGEEAAIMQAINEGVFDNPLKTKEFIERQSSSTVMDFVWSIYYNGILSGPPTNVVNLVSNTTWLSFQPFHRAVTAGIDAALSSPIAKAIFPHLEKRERSRYFAESLALFYGAVVGPTTREGDSVGGLPIAFKRMVHAFRTGEMPRTLHTKWAMELGSARLAFSRWAERPGSAPIRKWIAGVFEAPTRALIVVDVFFRSISYDAQMEALITRTSIQKGIPKLDVEITPVMRADALTFAGYTTFSDKQGKLARTAYSIRELIPMGRAVIPFVNTLTKILTRGIEMTPVFGVVQRQMSPVKTRDPIIETAAKQLEGTIALMILLTLFWDDDRITGAPPKEKGKRDAFYRAGKRPYAFKVGDTWIQYTRWSEPFSITIANIVAFRDGLKDDDPDLDPAERIITIGWQVADAILSNSFAENLRRITEREGRGLMNFINRLPSTFVPFSSFLRVVQRTYEAGKEGGVVLRERNNMMAHLADNIPWWEDPPARIDAFGEEIILTPDENNFVAALKQWLPFSWQKEEHDFVEIELAEREVYPQLPGKRLTIARIEVEIPEELWRDYAMIVGKDLKLAYAKVIPTPLYQRLGHSARLRLLDRVGERVRRRRREQLRRQLRASLREELRTARGEGLTRLGK